MGLDTEVWKQTPPFQIGIAAGFAAPAFSSNPVRYADGVVSVVSRDLESDGMGVPWGITRAWTNAQAQYRENVVGTRWIISEQPYIDNPSGDEYFVFSNSVTVRGFDLVDDEFVPQGFSQETLVHDDVNDEFVFTDTEGGVLKFCDLTTAHPELQRGQFKSFTDAKGNSVSVVDHTAEGRIEEVQRSSTVGGVTVIESYLYTYITTLVNDGLLESVVQRRKVDSGAWATVREAEYDYYGKDEDHGNRDNLRTATIKGGRLGQHPRPDLLSLLQAR